MRNGNMMAAYFCASQWLGYGGSKGMMVNFLSWGRHCRHRCIAASFSCPFPRALAGARGHKIALVQKSGQHFPTVTITPPPPFVVPRPELPSQPRNLSRSHHGGQNLPRLPDHQPEQGAGAGAASRAVSAPMRVRRGRGGRGARGDSLPSPDLGPASALCRTTPRHWTAGYLPRRAAAALNLELPPWVMSLA